MKLSANTLKAQLSKALSKRLEPLYIIAGDDPLLAGEIADQVRTAARDADYGERESVAVSDARTFPWHDTFSGLDHMSLFASRKLFELRIASGKPGREGGAALTAFAERLPQDTLSIIHLPYMSRQAQSAKWASTLARAGVWLNVPRVEPEYLAGWLEQRCRDEGISIEPAAAVMLAARTEGNLLAAKQEIDKLQLLYPGQVISLAAVETSVADGARFTVYQLAEAALAQDAPRALRVLLGLRREGIAAPLVCWALVSEISTLLRIQASLDGGASQQDALDQAGVWQQKQRLFAQALQAHTERSLQQLTLAATRTDLAVKGAYAGGPWNALYELVLLLARAPQPMSAVLAKGG